MANSRKKTSGKSSSGRRYSPAAAATFIFGIALLFVPGVVDWSSGWIWLKLAFVTGLGFSHGEMEKWRAAFAADRNQRSTRFFRIANEVPTLLMIGIVILVVAKPF